MYSRSAPRRRHGAEFKAKVLADCDEPGASISGVALAHGLNANLVRQWRAGRGARVASMGSTAPSAPKASRPTKVQASPTVTTTPEFIALEMPVPPKTATTASVDPTGATPTPSPTADQHIQVELRRGSLHLNVRWPTSAVDDCRAWLRELASGLVK
jgi:transposase